MIKKIMTIAMFVLMIVGTFCVYNDYKQKCYSKVGKDTVLYIDKGKFQLGKYNNKKHLEYYNSKGYKFLILEDVIAWKQTFRCTFLYSKKGYAVINRNGCKLCRLANTKMSEEAKKEKMIISDLSRFYPDIVLISSFDNFSDSEKEMFEKLRE